MMFTKPELIERHQSVQVKPLQFLQIERFQHQTHSWMRWESTCELYRGTTIDFDSAMQFYCTCCIEPHAEDQDFETWKDGWWGWFTTEISDALCLPISAQEFPSQTRQLFFEAEDSISLPDMGGFVAAFQMQDEWNEMGILAEFKNEFIYAHWRTSA